MHQQASFAKLAYRIKKCLTQLELLVVEMGTVEPWAGLLAHIAPRPGSADASPCRWLACSASTACSSDPTFPIGSLRWPAQEKQMCRHDQPHNPPILLAPR